MCSVKPRKASACSLPALTMPAVRQGYSGAYFASTRSCAAPSWPSRMMLSPFWSRKSRASSENVDRSRKNAWSCCSRSSRVPVVLIVLRRISAICGITSAYVVGDLGRQPEVLDDRRDLRVEPLEVRVDGLEVLADQLAATLERGGERVEGLVDLGGLDGPEQRVEVVEHLLDLDRDLRALDGGARLDVVARRFVGHLEGDVLLAEQRLGDDRAGDVGGDRAHLVGEEPEGQLRALGAGVEAEHLADDDAADLDVGPLGQLQAERRGLEGDLVVVDELLGEDAVGQPDARPAAGAGRRPRGPCGLRRRGMAQPASRTVVVVPQMAIDRNRSRTLIATMLVRTARPTATPTPAGPPRGVVAVVAVDQDHRHREDQHLAERPQHVAGRQELVEVVVEGARRSGRRTW